jgi:hypothetical protein
MAVSAELGFASLEQASSPRGFALAATSPQNQGRTPSQDRRLSRLQSVPSSHALTPRESATSRLLLSSRTTLPRPPAIASEIPHAAGIFASIEQSEENNGMEIHSVLRGGQLIKKVEPGDVLLSVDRVHINGFRSPAPSQSASVWLLVNQMGLTALGLAALRRCRSSFQGRRARRFI